MKYILTLGVIIGLQFQAIVAQQTLIIDNKNSNSTITSTTNTIEGITNMMLELISGDKGASRDWNTFKSLFLPSAQLMATNIAQDGSYQVSAMSIDEFVTNIGPVYSRDGFEEYSIGLTVNEFNGIANVFQSFYCKNLVGTYEKRGINSYQLIFKENRWWVANLLFTNETDKSPLPEKYLTKESQTNKRPKLNVNERKSKFTPLKP